MACGPTGSSGGMHLFTKSAHFDAKLRVTVASWQQEEPIIFETWSPSRGVREQVLKAKRLRPSPSSSAPTSPELCLTTPLPSNLRDSGMGD
ncbi:hypothetical protein VTH82DRAFT_1211 [Thermothelomyces myriococcoides]